MKLNKDNKNRIIAELMEPEVPEVSQHQRAIPILPEYSPEGAWEVVQDYFEGDVYRWEPRYFTYNFELAMTAYYALIGPYIELYHAEGHDGYWWRAYASPSHSWPTYHADAKTASEAIIDLILEVKYEMGEL